MFWGFKPFRPFQLFGLALVARGALGCYGEPLVIIPEKNDPRARRVAVIDTIGKLPALNFGVTPYTDDEDELKNAYSPFIHYLAEKLDRKVRLIIADDYLQLVDYLKAGKIHFGSFSTSTYYSAKRKLGKKIRYIGTSVSSQTSRENPYYRGVIFARKTSPIKTIKGLKGKTFAFTDRGSASGYKFAVHKLLQFGIQPHKHLKKTLMMGSHNSAMQAVIKGKADAGVAVEGLYRPFVKKRKEAGKKKNLKIIGFTDPIPNDAVCSGAFFPADLLPKLKNTLIALESGMKNYRGEQVINLEDRFPYRGWVVKNQEFYDSISTVIGAVDAYEKIWFKK